MGIQSRFANMVKLIGLILATTLLFGVCKASFNEDFCPEGSQLFLVDPNHEGTCPDVLPTVNTENEENEKKCEEDMNAALTKCGLCMEFGDTNMTKVESNPNYTPKQDVPCMETGERDISMNETTLDRYDWCAKLYQHNWYNGWQMVVGAERRINHLKHLNDQTSSVRVRHGCTLKLFKHVNYDWLLGSLTHDVSALPAYNDQVSSLTCTCSQQRLEFSGYWGDWGPKQFCQNGGYAIGFATKVEGRQGDGDDTAMNGLKLQCSGRDFITSAVQTWGSWNYAWNSCRSGYTGAKVAVERPQGGGDDTATNCVQLFCKGGGNWISTNNCRSWGTWRAPKYCGSGKKICAIQTRVERVLGKGDDTALNNINLYCC